MLLNRGRLIDELFPLDDEEENEEICDRVFATLPESTVAVVTTTRGGGTWGRN